MKLLNPLAAPARLRAGLEAASAPAFKLTFATLLILAALGVTYTDSLGNFPPFELRSVLWRGMAVSGVLFLGALAISMRFQAVGNGTLALVTCAGIFTAFIVHTELFYPANRVWLVVVCVATFFTLFVAYRIIDEFRWGGLGLVLIAVVVAATVAWAEAGPEIKRGLSTPGGLIHMRSIWMWLALVGVCACSGPALHLMSRIVVPSHWGGFALMALVLGILALFFLLGHKFGGGGGDNERPLEAIRDYYVSSWDDDRNVQFIAFQETPNVYLVGFDAITPRAITKRFMGIEGTDFHSVMDKDMRRFRNLFASAVSTRHSLNTLLALDLDLYLLDRQDTRTGPNYFAGHDLSPLVWLLRRNGYETTSVFENAYLGNRGGPGIDNYIINRRVALCSLLSKDVRLWAFWGYCWNQDVTSFRPSQLLSRDNFFVEEVTGIDRSRPHFVISHIWLPGHTSSPFDYENQNDKDTFFKLYHERFDSAAIVLRQIIDHLRFNDPNAILFVYGDHGAWLSSSMKIEDDPEFFLQDRFGILGGVYPPDRCAAEFDEAESKGYVTSLDIVHAILECLSGGQSPLREPRNDRFWGGGVPEDHSYRYEDFLYE